MEIWNPTGTTDHKKLSDLGVKIRRLWTTYQHSLWYHVSHSSQKDCLVVAMDIGICHDPGGIAPFDSLTL